MRDSIEVKSCLASIFFGYFSKRSETRVSDSNGQRTSKRSTVGQKRRLENERLHVEVDRTEIERIRVGQLREHTRVESFSVEIYA